ncbi:uncharacterized protein G2W53_000375 [Senna tora]|uniref:Uncharacterized protein n=1 Tax=Senna tora TaxID=362788 RepID=A0A834XFE8_9FABA|nr:uncharacterized protein G2W53_000375 [Senna tora]
MGTLETICEVLVAHYDEGAPKDESEPS